MSESGRKKRSRCMYMAKADEILDSSTQANADISLSQGSENHTHDAHIGCSQHSEFSQRQLEYNLVTRSFSSHCAMQYTVEIYIRFIFCENF